MSAFASHADGVAAYHAFVAASRELGPDHADTLALRTLVEIRQGDARRALATARAAIRACPYNGPLWQRLGWAHEALGENVEALASYRRAVMLEPGNFTLWPSLIWLLDQHEYSTPEQRLEVRAQVEMLHVAPLVRAARPHTNDPDPHRKLRIGYSSADFHRHSAGFTFSLPLRHHDRDQFEIVCYDSREYPADPMTTMMRSSVDLWRSVADMDDAALADQIRADQIDILVDLSGVTSGGRLLAMARRPAPVQITAWGYATGLGLSYVDYLLSDRVVIPSDRQYEHREQILYLPSLMAADLEATGDPMPDITPRSADRPPTFGYFGRAMKLTDRMLGVWAQILQAVPDSRLIFKCSDCKDAQRIDRILDVFIGLGVDGHRIEFRGETSRVEHLAQHNDIDICLDTSPVGGGTTTLDACLMGVPTVTLLGDTVPGRISASILKEIGEPPPLARTSEEYVHNAIWRTMPSDQDRLDRRSRFLNSIICDGDRYAKACEEAYRFAWSRWCATQRVEMVV